MGLGACAWARWCGGRGGFNNVYCRVGYVIEMKGEGTISSVVEDNLCTGCGTCVALCPNEAIEMVIDEKKGIYVPELDERKCNNCGICFKVCPGHEVDFKGLNLEIFGKEPDDILIGNYLNCYVGHATDYDIRYNSASGGLITALLIFALEEGLIDGALVTRMKKDKPLEPEPFIARTREEIIEARGSKYCPVPANVALKEILEADEGERFAVVGLPCHIQGVRKAEQVNTKLREKIVLHLGLFCINVQSTHATELLLHKLGIKRENVKKINYRGQGWPGGMNIWLKDGTIKFIKTGEYYDELFGAFKPRRCLLCWDHAAEFSDISFADAWHEKDKDNIGLSIIISRNNKADEILQKMVNNGIIKLSKITDEEVKKSQSYMSFKKRDFRARIALAKLLGKKTPYYNINFQKSPTNAYISAVLLYTDNFLINHNLWELLKYEIRLRSKIISWRNKS